MNDHAKVSLFGAEIDAIDMAAAVDEVLRWQRSPRAGACRFVVTPNVDHAVMFQTSEPLRQAYAAASLVLADAEGTDSVDPAEFQAAEPDPFCLHEDSWLRHLELSHRDVVGLLSRHLPEQLRGGHVRPLGLDKHGLRLRVESADGDHDVRLAFSQPVTTTEHLGKELRRLVGCPFLAQQRTG